MLGPVLTSFQANDVEFILTNSGFVSSSIKYE